MSEWQHKNSDSGKNLLMLSAIECLTCFTTSKITGSKKKSYHKKHFTNLNPRIRRDSINYMLNERGKLIT